METTRNWTFMEKITIALMIFGLIVSWPFYLLYWIISHMVPKRQFR